VYFLHENANFSSAGLELFIREYAYCLRVLKTNQKLHFMYLLIWNVCIFFYKMPLRIVLKCDDSSLSDWKKNSVVYIIPTMYYYIIISHASNKPDQVARRKLWPTLRWVPIIRREQSMSGFLWFSFDIVSTYSNNNDNNDNMFYWLADSTRRLPQTLKRRV